MKITMLGTGHGTVTECYNTCFTIENNSEYFLVDSGGGNGILKQLKDSNIEIEKLLKIFISHTHSDHILGVIWIIRVLTRKCMVEGYNMVHYIYGNNEVIDAIRQICKILLPEKHYDYIDKNILLIPVNNNETINILNREITFFDTNSFGTKQYGFYFDIRENERFTFIGDEYCSENTKKYVKDSKWLFADAYKTDIEKYEIGKRYRHSTVKQVAELCEQLNVKNVILSHSTDNNLKMRKELFVSVAKQYFKGNVFVPNDLETINLN